MYPQFGLMIKYKEAGLRMNFKGCTYLLILHRGDVQSAQVPIVQRAVITFQMNSNFQKAPKIDSFYGEHIHLHRTENPRDRKIERT